MGEKLNMKMIIEDLEDMLSSNFGPNYIPPQSHHCLVNSVVNLKTLDTKKGTFEGLTFYAILNYF